MRVVRLCLLACACGGTSGCSEPPVLECAVFCGVLPPAITFRVIDGVDGGHVAGARINGLPCGSGCAGQLPDGGVIEQAGTFEFLADAAGYHDLRFEIVVPAGASFAGQCCGIPFVPQQRDVALQPL